MTTTYFIDMWSFGSFNEKVFLLANFEHNTLCHHGARLRSKHRAIKNGTVLLNILFPHTCSKIKSLVFKVFNFFYCVTLSLQ